MEDLQSTLQSILSDPEQMQRIAAMAEAKGLKPPDGNTGPGDSAHREEPAPQSGGPQLLRHSEQSPESVPLGMPDLSALMGSLSAMQGSEDRVFSALRPSLSPTGQGKADRALRAAKLSKLAARFLTRQRNGHV